MSPTPDRFQLYNKCRGMPAQATHAHAGWARLSSSPFFSSCVSRRCSGTSTCFVILISSSASLNCAAQPTHAPGQQEPGRGSSGLQSPLGPLRCDTTA